VRGWGGQEVDKKGGGPGDWVRAREGSGGSGGGEEKGLGQFFWGSWEGGDGGREETI